MQSATSEQNSSEADSERERNPTLCSLRTADARPEMRLLFAGYGYYVNKWNVNQNVSLVPRVEKAKSSQSFDYEFVILFYYFCDLIVHFVKFLKSLNILSMISHFIS